MGCGPCADRALYIIGEPIYDPLREYDAGDYVIVSGVLYVSMEDGNEGNNPQESDEWGRTTILEQLSEIRALTRAAAILLALGYIEFGGGTYAKGTGVQHNGHLCIANIETDNNPPPDAPGTYVTDPEIYEYWNVFSSYQEYQRFLLNP